MKFVSLSKDLELSAKALALSISKSPFQIRDRLACFAAEFLRATNTVALVLYNPEDVRSVN
jgi:hypothetical protein